MQLTNTLLLALATKSAYAHWFLKCITRPDESCNVGVEGAHMNPYIDNHPEGTDWPRTSPCAAGTDPNMQCGISGIPGDNIDPINVEPGMTLTAWFAHTARTDDYDKRIHSNHHGFTQVYLTPYASRDQNQWTKIFTKGFISNDDHYRQLWSDGSLNDNQGTQFVGAWATDQMRYDGGKFEFTVPQGTPNGKYILRGEVLANLLPNTAVPGAQGYIGCVPIVVGSGSDNSASLPGMSHTVAIPQDYANEVFVTSYDTFSDLSQNIPNTPGGEAWTGGAVSKREVLRRSRHFHAHLTAA